MHHFVVIQILKALLELANLTLSPRKAEKPASPTVTNSCKAEIPACRSLIYSHNTKISA